MGPRFAGQAKVDMNSLASISPGAASYSAQPVTELNHSKHAGASSRHSQRNGAASECLICGGMLNAWRLLLGIPFCSIRCHREHDDRDF